METEDWRQVLAVVCEYQSWLKVIASAFFTLLMVYVGHWLTLRMSNKRAVALEVGLVNELSVIKEHFQTWLKGLVDELNTPVRPKYSGFTEIDMSCIDSLVVELIAVNIILTKDQRKFLLFLKAKIRDIPKKDQQRDRASKWNESKGAHLVATPCTARLIIDAVEIISYLSRYIKSKNKFYLKNDILLEDHARRAFSEAGIEYSPELWGKISTHNLGG